MNAQRVTALDFGIALLDFCAALVMTVQTILIVMACVERNI